MHRLTELEADIMSLFQNGGDDVISCEKVLLSGEWTRSVCLALAATAICCICRSVCRLPASNSLYSSWSRVHSCLL